MVSRGGLLPERPFPPFPFRINKGLLLAGGAALLFFVLLPVLAEFYTDYLWYDTEDTAPSSGPVSLPAFPSSGPGSCSTPPSSG